jgi:hypothetical protein
MQQKAPETAHVVTPGTEYLPETYRVADLPRSSDASDEVWRPFRLHPLMMAFIPTQSSIAKSADGASPVLQGDAPTITYRLS